MELDLYVHVSLGEIYVGGGLLLLPLKGESFVGETAFILGHG